MNTSELKGAALDWAVAKCEGYIDNPDSWLYQAKNPENLRTSFRPSMHWAQGGPIIERECIAIDFDGKVWTASHNERPICYSAKTPLEAAMRCHVASKLGDKVEIHHKLIKG